MNAKSLYLKSTMNVNFLYLNLIFLIIMLLLSYLCFYIILNFIFILAGRVQFI